jgi:putative membrane protein
MILVAVEGSLNQSINKAQRHYSSLFFLPSLKTALIANAVLCLLTGAVSSVLFQSPSGIFAGLILGSALVAMTFFSDLVISQLVLKDPIFVLRRVSVLSLCGWLFWFVLITLGVIFGGQFGFLWWVKMCLLGFSVILTLRTIVFFATLSTSQTRRFIAILLQPYSCLIPLVIFWTKLNVSLNAFLPFLIISPIIAVGFGYLFLHFLNRIGKKAYGIDSMPLFRAFMLNWVTAQNGPLEAILEKLGEDTDVEVSLLKFDAQKPKAAVIVPLVHPGPFKNIGSSVLPSLIKHAYEKEYGGDACTALGLLGHERNAASQAQNQKIIKSIIDAAKFNSKIDKATPFVRVSEDFVTASCQIFGQTAFLSFTLAPKTTEDLPQELGSIVCEEAKKLGLDDAILINAHNSITNTNEIETSIETLHAVASKCLQKAISNRSYPFEVGTATIYPKEFTLKDGMGAGGITSLVVKVGEQKTAYVIIDGNNMISGLREKILSELARVGFDESEIFTTDTHSVSALVRGSRGYNPVGEAMNQENLVAYIKEAAQIASNRLESCRAGYIRIVVPNIRVMGVHALEPLTVLVDQSIQKAKQIVGPIFGLEGLLLILLLL